VCSLARRSTHFKLDHQYVFDDDISKQIISLRLTLMNADFSLYTAFRLVLESNTGALDGFLFVFFALG
jgi:hypothetical protein